MGKSGDSAVSGTDYVAVPKFNVTIPAGRTSGSTAFNLQPLNDHAWEGDETITFHGTGISDGVQSATMTLTDEADRPGPPVTLSVNPSSVNEADAATTVTVTASSDAHSFSRKVAVALVGVGVGRGQALMGWDYEWINNFDITIPADATSATRTFTLTPKQDTAEEGDEAIEFKGSVVNGTVTGTTLTLTDDDEVPLALSVNPATASEDGGAKTVTVTATAKTAFTYARTIAVAAGKLTDSATPVTDYALVPFFDVTVPGGLDDRDGYLHPDPGQ